MMDSPSELSQLFSPSQQMISDDIWHKIAHMMNIGLKKENELTRLKALPLQNEPDSPPPPPPPPPSPSPTPFAQPCFSAFPNDNI